MGCIMAGLGWGAGAQEMEAEGSLGQGPTGQMGRGQNQIPVACGALSAQPFSQSTLFLDSSVPDPE